VVGQVSDLRAGGLALLDRRAGQGQATAPEGPVVVGVPGQQPGRLRPTGAHQRLARP
jgi:hypothetical protein